ncbi:MAG: hypothetical protein M1823_003433 [Watsoniomyces obsoletus]|nr:MAG: hypothetical protein M1823_003433 [Watsoniomyces obsoletus]
MSTAFGNFHNFCRDSTLPVCNLFNESPNKGGADFGGCQQRGISLRGGRVLANLGSMIIAALAILTAMFLIWRSERKRAAVGRREIQLFLLSYILVSICEIITVGGFPLSSNVRIAFTGIHLGAVVASAWILLMNAVVGFQLLDDGTPLSIGLILFSAVALFVGTGYIALDTGYSWTGRFDSSLTDPNRNIGLYVLYQLAPLVFLVLFFLLELLLVLRVLGEVRPILYLIAATLLFAIGQIFQYVISPHLCNASNGRIDGALFQTLFTLLSVVALWIFWSSITEDDWPMFQPAPSPAMVAGE